MGDTARRVGKYWEMEVLLGGQDCNTIIQALKIVNRILTPCINNNNPYLCLSPLTRSSSLSSLSLPLFQLLLFNFKPALGGQQQFNHRMHFSSVPTLIDAHIQSLLENSTLKSASLFLFVANKNPLLLEDTNKVQLTASEDDLQAYFQSYDKIEQGSNISLDNLTVHIDFGKGHSINKVELSSKKVFIEIGSTKEKELKNFEIRLTLSRVNGEFPLTINTYNYLRRMERQELAKKHYKPSKVDLLAFTTPNRRVKRSDPSENPEINALDSESIALLRGLVEFVDKEELFRVLLKKNLKDRQSKKTVRMAIVPTDVEQESEGFEIKKKSFNRNTIQELLAEYEAREERIRG